MDLGLITQDIDILMHLKESLLSYYTYGVWNNTEEEYLFQRICQIHVEIKRMKDLGCDFTKKWSPSWLKLMRNLQLFYRILLGGSFRIFYTMKKAILFFKDKCLKSCFHKPQITFPCLSLRNTRRVWYQNYWKSKWRENQKLIISPWLNNFCFIPLFLWPSYFLCQICLKFLYN